MAVHVVPVQWAERAADLRRIRHQVFVIEQQVPEELEWDAEDPPGTHFMALDSTGQVLGCARLTQAGQIGRMAVLAPLRGRGIGAALLSAALTEAREQHFEEVFLHAQTHAEGFYRKAGFLPEGEQYLEAGIEHIGMRMALPIAFEAQSEAAPANATPSRPEGLPPGPPATNVQVAPQSFDDERSALAALVECLEEPTRRLCVFSPELDSALFDQPDVAERMSRFVRASPRAKLRILIYSSRAIVSRGHRLLELSRRLDDKIELRRVPEEYAKDERSFAVWDLQGYWLLPNASDYQGLANGDDPVMAKRLQERFDYLWERSSTDPELRTLKL